MTLARAVTLAGWSAAVLGVLGFAASLGHGWLGLAAWLAPFLHLLLGLLGAAAAVAASRRTEQIDRQRFEIATAPAVTRGERELAHREAERQIRTATTALVAAPLLLGYWLAYELPAGVGPWGRALPATALAGFAVAFWLGRKSAG